MGMVSIVPQDDAISEFTKAFFLDHDTQHSKNFTVKFLIDTISLHDL
jgi:hypothetical protein